MLREQAIASRPARIRLARVDPNTFIEFVLRHEKTGAPIIQAPIHEAWQDLANRYERLLIWAHVGAGKTSQLSIGRTLWELGRNPSLRVVILSNTLRGQSTKLVRALKKYIEESDELHEVFPNLIPDTPWTDDQLTVKRPIIAKDPSIQATSVHGNILGARIDYLIVDDILDVENTRTEYAMEGTWDWYQGTIPGRMTKKSRAICVGNAWHEKDMLHRLAKQGWQSYRYPVVDEHGEPRWPEEWPAEVIARMRKELGPIESARQLDCVARNDQTSRFKMAWISKALARGNGLPAAHRLRSVPTGCRVITGVDLAVSKKDSADESALVTVLEFGNHDRRLLNITAGRWSGPEIVREIKDIYLRFHSIFWVETNAAQEYLVQFINETDAIPVHSFVTGRNKMDSAFGIESLATEFDNGKWIIPNENGLCEPEIEKLIGEMLWYDPTKHTGDRLMATWIAREGIRDIGEDTEGEVGWIDLRR
jgi:hypothetical protein